jgi:O-antigen/teichoic acid export membrane protein
MNIKDLNDSRSTVGDAVEADFPEVSTKTENNISNDDHFRTDEVLANLKNRTVASGFITLGSQGVQFGLTLVSTMILARLLTPGDFGLVAMVWTVMGFLRVFKEAGLSTATVQREGITHAQVSNLFWINLAVSGFITLLAAASAPGIAWFYREPRLVGITAALSVTFLLAGLAVQHMALLNRQMRFKAIAVIQIGSVLAGVVVGIGMAWLKYGYWSLVGLNVTTNLVALLMTWFVSEWRPQSFAPGSGARTLIHFGANLTAGSFLYSIARGLDGLLIGRFYGAVSVGLYSRAAALLARPLEQFSGPIEAVFIPALSRLQTQPERYRHTFLQVYETIALTSFLFTGMFFALAHPLTLVVLGPKWEGAAVIFAGLTFAALQYPLGSCASWLFTSQGRGRESFLASSIMSIVITASFIAGLPFGPAGVAIAYSASCLLIQLPIFYWLVGRRGPVSAGDLWIGFLRQLPLWGVVSLVTWLVRIPIPDDQPFTELLIAAPSSLVAGIAFIFVYSPARRVALNLFFLVRGLKNPT